ncbi:MAG TPA: hypothetical protein VLA34_14090, partial [Candidatus Krumholzibacterium sp.]|nr:hypothetical protein [Candidatus Krumholzibacterium sp.]
MKNIIRISILAALLLAAFQDAGAVSKLEGYYEIETSLKREGLHWQFGPPGGNGMPKHYLELKYLTWPYKNLETYFKLRAESNRDEYLTPESEFKRPEYLSAEGHLKLNGDKWESYLFIRQNRFWIHDEPLLNLVEQDKLKNDNWGPQSSGVRADFWNFDLGKVKGIGGTFVYFDDGGTFNWTPELENTAFDGTDNFIGRLRKNSFSDRLELGTTFLRKDWTNTSVGREYVSQSFNEVLAVDASFYPREFVSTGLNVGPLNLENSSWIAEYAVSRDPYQTATSEIRSNRNRFAFASE